MTILTKREFAELAGVKVPAIYKAVKAGRLSHYQESNKIDTDSRQAQDYLNNIPTQRQPTVNKSLVESATNGETQEQDEGLKKAGTKVLNAQAKKIIESAEREKQQRIKLELQNAFARGQMVAIDAIEQSIMLWMDRWLSENERGWNGKYLEFKRLILEVEEGKLSDNEVRQLWKDWFMERAHIAKTSTTEKLRAIQETQGCK